MDLRDFENVELCNMETGEYFKAIGVTEESGKTVLMIEKADIDDE